MSAKKPTAIERMLDATVECVKCGTQGVGNCSCWDAPEPPKFPREAPDVLLAIADAAVMWWKARRPIALDLEQHLETPHVGCTTAVDRDLAAQAAKWCALNRGIVA